jgi:hypothetical protein
MRKRFAQDEGREGVRVDGTGSRFLAELRGRKPSPRPTEREGVVWRVVDDYGQAVGKLQAESMMSTAASLFPQ